MPISVTTAILRTLFIFALVILASKFVKAEEATPEPDPIGFGLYYDNNKQGALVIGDQNLFKQNQKYYGLRRYGGGGGRFQMGNIIGAEVAPNLGVHANGNSGFTLVGLKPEDTNTLYPQIGLEVLNGRVAFNTSPYIQDYYQGFLGPSLGAQADVAGCRVLPLIRGGGAAGTLGKNGLLPNFNVAYGYAGHFNCYVVDASYGKLFLHDTNKPGKYLEDVSLMVNLPKQSQIGVQVERVNGLSQETSYSILFKNILK